VQKLFHMRLFAARGLEAAAAPRRLARFREAPAEGDIEVMDIGKKMPECDGERWWKPKYARAERGEHSLRQRDAFAERERMAMRFALANRVLISPPMWNFGFPL